MSILRVVESLWLGCSTNLCAGSRFSIWLNLKELVLADVTINSHSSLRSIHRPFLPQPATLRGSVQHKWGTHIFLRTASLHVRLVFLSKAALPHAAMVGHPQLLFKASPSVLNRVEGFLDNYRRPRRDENGFLRPKTRCRWKGKPLAHPRHWQVYPSISRINARPFRRRWATSLARGLLSTYRHCYSLKQTFWHRPRTYQQGQYKR